MEIPRADLCLRNCLLAGRNTPHAIPGTMARLRIRLRIEAHADRKPRVAVVLGYELWKSPATVQPLTANEQRWSARLWSLRLMSKLHMY